MRWLGLVVVFWASVALAEDLYVRPPLACPVNGDGTSYTCATTANGPGAWNGLGKVQYSATDAVKKVDAGDTLYVCGAHHVSIVQERLFPIVSGNATDGPITITGRCPMDYGSISGMKTHVRMINLQTDQTHYIFEYLTIYDSGPDEYPVSLYGTATNPRFITVRHSRFLDNGLGLATIFAWGSDFTFEDNYFDGTGDDAVHVEGGKNLIFTRNTCRNLSLKTAGGDCLQRNVREAAGDTGYTYVNDNDIEKDVDWKYGILIGDNTGYTEVQRNRVKCLAGPSTNPNGCSPIFVGGSANPAHPKPQLIVRGNHTWGGWRGVTIHEAHNADVPALVQANIIEYAGTIGEWLWKSTQVVSTHNIFAHNGQYGSYGDQVAPGVFYHNNIFVQNGVGLYYGQPIGGHSHNSYFGQTGWNVQAGSVEGQLECSDTTEDPLFVSATEYRLQATSPLRGAGMLTAPCVDYRGRPCLTPVSIGAYQ